MVFGENGIFEIYRTLNKNVEYALINNAFVNGPFNYGGSTQVVTLLLDLSLTRSEKMCESAGVQNLK